MKTRAIILSIVLIFAVPALSSAQIGNVLKNKVGKAIGAGVKVLNKLPADTVLMVQLTSDVVRLVEGFDLQAVEWQTEGGTLTKYKIMSIVVPQIRSDRNGKCGIVQLS